MMDYSICLLETKWNIEITQMGGASSAKLGWTLLSYIIETTCKFSSISSHFLWGLATFIDFDPEISRESLIAIAKFPAYSAVFLMPRVKKSSTLWSNMGNTPEIWRFQ